MQLLPAVLGPTWGLGAEGAPSQSLRWGRPRGLITRPTFVNLGFSESWGGAPPCRAIVCQGANPLPLAPVLFEAGGALLCRFETRASCTRFFHQNQRVVGITRHPSRPESSYSDFAPVPRKVHSTPFPPQRKYACCCELSSYHSLAGHQADLRGWSTGAREPTVYRDTSEI